MIYDYALDDNHDIFADGLPALLKVCPQITREIYSYRDIVTTVIVTKETLAMTEEAGEALLSRYINIITKFDQTKNTKKLVVRIRLLAYAIPWTHDTRMTLIKGCFYALAIDMANYSRLGRSRKVSVEVDDMSRQPA